MYLIASKGMNKFSNCLRIMELSLKNRQNHAYRLFCVRSLGRSSSRARPGGVFSGP